ncbi:hypothetical protein HELRODRAFT_74707, partial [Helobdella robusta]|uniref:Fibrinogen C-terminal domain-containing protein n=1 Tax=Helobdella robusta TaxID=6412 RepID=T1G1U7_HELRO
VFQRRIDGSVDFYRTWDEYLNGFGNLNEEFWLGNRLVHELTTKRSYKLKVEAVAFDGSTFHSFNSNFNLSSLDNKFAIWFSDCYGSTYSCIAPTNISFSTWDNDNDLSGSNCALAYRGAWWYTACHGCNLNGIYYPGGNHSGRYASGVDWSAFRGYYESMKMTWMMISRM